ncbi:hypothetical protein GGI23_007195, partial [Coemansia sp. RSA 2559]
MSSSHLRQDDHRYDRAPVPSLPPPPPQSFGHAQTFAPGPPPQNALAGGQMGMHIPPYARAPGYMSYGMPPPRKVPRIRHPNRPPCTVPSKTLYIRNLRENTKIPVLVTALKTLFETYGEVAEVRARHSIRMRGQAFVVFKDIDDAIKAHREVQGFVLFGKPMFIEFSRIASDITVASEGGNVDEHKNRRTAEKEERELAAQEKEAQAVSASAALEPELPNKILFLQGLPADIKISEIET